jgi:hypothetical protein
MDEPPELQYDGHWRMAWVLAVGEIIWLAAEAVTLAGFFWSRHELPEPRPGYWSMRFMLIHDTVRAQSSAQRS